MMTNEDRVEDITSSVMAFAARMGLAPELDADGPVTVAGDMIASILHWVQQETGKREDALDAVRSAVGHYATESYIDYSAVPVDELGPHSYVSITVECNGDTWHTQTAVPAWIEGEPI